MRTLIQHSLIGGALASAALFAGCSDSTSTTEPSDHVMCDAGNGGISLPDGFCAVVVADLTEGGEAARARHMVITPAGDVFVAINSPNNQEPPFGVIGLRDTDGDGHADRQTTFSPSLGGSGLAWRDGLLYLGANDRVMRFHLASGAMMPEGDGEVVVSGLPSTGDHISKTLVLPDAQHLFVNLGSSSNSCQAANRQLHSPGVFPCPDLPSRAGVWVFDPAGTNQTEASGQHYATGYRNLVALDVNPITNTLYGVQHGRDMLFENWPESFTVEDDAALPAEEFVRIDQDSNNGWPYCFYDAVSGMKKVLAPEFGGDGHKVSGGPHSIDCAGYNQPLATFGAHWAPNGLHFYRGSQFPAHYRNGAFVAFHGGFDRAPLPNEGYQVMFVPMSADGTPSGAPEPFANGFAGSSGTLPESALHRPVGVAEGPDGSLYVSDDRGGRIWRIIYRP